MHTGRDAGAMTQRQHLSVAGGDVDAFNKAAKTFDENRNLQCGRSQAANTRAMQASAESVPGTHAPC